jgi:hypothetical protein
MWVLLLLMMMTTCLMCPLLLPPGCDTSCWHSNEAHSRQGGCCCLDSSGGLAPLAGGPQDVRESGSSCTWGGAATCCSQGTLASKRGQLCALIILIVDWSVPCRAHCLLLLYHLGSSPCSLLGTCC